MKTKINNWELYAEKCAVRIRKILENVYCTYSTLLLILFCIIMYLIYLNIKYIIFFKFILLLFITFYKLFYY